MIRVVVADDHAIVRAGVRALFEAEGDIAIVGEASDGPAALEATRRLGPDVLMLDLSMPEGHGLLAIERARTEAPRTRVLVLSMHAAPEQVRPAMRAGASGYVVKGSGLGDLVNAVRAVASGERYVDSRIASTSLDGEDELDRLSPREREVLQRVAQGRTNREIAAQLGISPKTVDTHRMSVMRKLDLHDAQALTRFAVRRGLIA